MKAGWKTTEFYITLAAAVGSAAASLAGALPPTWGATLVSVSGGAYAVSRGLAKLNDAGITSLDPAAILALVEKIIESHKPVPPPAPPTA